MEMIQKSSLRAALLLGLIMAGCSGGGGGDGDGNGGGSGGVGVDGLPTGVSRWDVRASATTDNCNDRLTNIRQTFTVNRDRQSFTVNSGITSLSAVADDAGITAGISANGFDPVRDETCSRTISMTLGNFTETTADYTSEVQTTCGAFQCVNQWTGTATRLVDAN